MKEITKDTVLIAVKSFVLNFRPLLTKDKEYNIVYRDGKLKVVCDNGDEVDLPEDKETFDANFITKSSNN
jgi:hypothetical protein